MWRKFRKDLEIGKKARPYFHRNFEHDFVLKYFPDLVYVNLHNFPVLDVGCCESLLMFELDKRGYDTFGVDMRIYEHKLPNDIKFIQADITSPHFLTIFNQIKFKMIVALSTIEHIGKKCYGKEPFENGDRLALENIHKVLNDNGYFIITVPGEAWHSDSGKGYSPKEFLRVINGLFDVFEITNAGGQICAALVKH